MASSSTSGEIHSCEMPLPTRDITEAAHAFKTTGICVIPEVIFGEKLRKLRNAIYSAAEDDREYGRVAFLLTDDQASRWERSTRILARKKKSFGILSPTIRDVKFLRRQSTKTTTSDFISNDYNNNIVQLFIYIIFENHLLYINV